MEWIILFLAGLAALVAASINDIKAREVPDWLSFALIAAGLGIRAIFSISLSDYHIILEGLIGLAIMVAFGYAMYYSGQWGGGDSKILMGLGAIMGFRLSLDHGIALLVVNLLFIGAGFGIIWNIVLAVRHWKDFSKAFNAVASKKYVKIARAALAVLSLCVIILSWTLIDGFLRFSVISLLLIAIFLFYSVLAAKAVEKSCMIKPVGIDRLTEGDWVAEEVKDGKKRICGPKDLGLTKEQIKLLEGMRLRGKIRFVKVKEGIPFVPAILLSFIFSYWFGNIIFYILGTL